PLPPSYHASGYDLSLYISAVDREHFQLYAAVGEKNARAGLDFARQAGKIGGDERSGSGHGAGPNGQTRPGLQHHGLATFQASSANLGALKILKDAERPFQPTGGAT